MINRRSFLRRSAAATAAAPIGAQMVGQESTLKAAGIDAIGIGVRTPQAPEIANGRAAQTLKIFRSFTDWMREHGDAEIKEHAKEVRVMDPDIISMRSLPLCTKIRMQQKRNYERILEHRRGWFDSVLRSEGDVRVWR